MVDIAKGNMFCNALFIEEQANLIFSNLKKENYLTGLTQEAFIKRLAIILQKLMRYTHFERETAELKGNLFAC